MKKLRLTEEALIRLLRDRQALGARALYDMYSSALYGVISRILNDLHSSEDALQDTFIKIWQSIDQYEVSKGRLFTWMVNIARNVAIDRLRSKHYKYAQCTEGLEGCEQIAGEGDLLEFGVDRQLIRRGVDRLRLPEIAVVNLIYFKGYTQQETAVTLGIPLGTVKTRLTMAIKNLRHYYGEASLGLAS